MPPQQQNQYDFIMDNPKKSGGPSFLRNSKSKIIVSVLFVSVVLIVVIVGFNIISSLGKTNNDDLVDLMARQLEISRISEIGISGSDSQTIKTKIATLNSIMKSDYREIRSYLTQIGYEIEPLKVRAHRDGSVDKALEESKVADQYDTTLLKYIEQETTAYKSALNSAINATTTPGREKTLNTAATNIIVYDGKVATE